MNEKSGILKPKLFTLDERVGLFIYRSPDEELDGICVSNPGNGFHNIAFAYSIHAVWAEKKPRCISFTYIPGGSVVCISEENDWDSP